MFGFDASSTPGQSVKANFSRTQALIILTSAKVKKPGSKHATHLPPPLVVLQLRLVSGLWTKNRAIGDRRRLVGFVTWAHRFRACLQLRFEFDSTPFDAIHLRFEYRSTTNPNRTAAESCRTGFE